MNTDCGITNPRAFGDFKVMTRCAMGVPAERVESPRTPEFTPA